MRRLSLVVLLVLGRVCSQEVASSDIERVVAVLRAGDPVHDGGGAVELLGPGAALDAAILAVARSAKAERSVRLRALRLHRALRLASRLKVDRQPRDVGWWLALDEISREVPESLRVLLLSRSGLDPQTLVAAQRELTAAREHAERFCREWNETRFLDEAHAAQNRAYDALEAAITKAGNAAVPTLLNILVVPPDVSFSSGAAEDITARQQVRAIHALSRFVRAKEAMPFFVMHTAGPSLTQSSVAGEALQLFSGEDFGAGVLVGGNDELIIAWWREHMSTHELVLDYLVQHVIGFAAGIDMSLDLSSGMNGTEALQSAVVRLDRALGKVTKPAPDVAVEALRARLSDAEFDWLRRQVR